MDIFYPEGLAEECAQIVLKNGLDLEEPELVAPSLDVAQALAECWKSGWDACMAEVVRQAEAQGLHLMIHHRRVNPPLAE